MNFAFIVMSIALMRRSSRGGSSMQRSVYVNGHEIAGERRLAEERREKDDLEESNSSSSVSDDEGFEESEVQSDYKGPLDTMDALKEVLPIRKGISNFYSGKSRSFTNLADVSSTTTIKDLEKPEDPYATKRRTLGHIWEKNCGIPPRDGRSGALQRAAASEVSCSTASPPSSTLPPLHRHSKREPINGSRSSPPHKNSPWRSFSYSDLQCAAVVSSNN